MNIVKSERPLLQLLESESHVIGHMQLQPKAS